MTGSAKIRRFFGDDTHDFRLAIGQAEELQDQFGIGLVQMYDRVAAVCVIELREVLCQALIGGGMPAERARRYVARHMVEGRLIEAAGVAGAAIEALLRGEPDDPVGDDAPGEDRGVTGETLNPLSQTDDFDIAASTSRAAD